MTLREAARQALDALKIPPGGRDLNEQALACYRAEAIDQGGRNDAAYI